MKPLSAVKPKPNQCPKPAPISPVSPVLVPEEPTVEEDFLSWPLGVGIAAGVVVLLLIGILSYVLIHRKLKRVPQVSELPIDFDPITSQVNQGENVETQNKL